MMSHILLATVIYIYIYIYNYIYTQALWGFYSYINHETSTKFIKRIEKKASLFPKSHLVAERLRNICITLTKLSSTKNSMPDSKFKWEEYIEFKRWQVRMDPCLKNIKALNVNFM